MYKTVESIFSTDKSTFDRNKDIIINLKFIGTIQKGEKIDVKNSKVEENNLFTPLRRMLTGESRDTSLQFINTTIDRSFEIINSYVHSDKLSERKFVTNVVLDLYKTISGLKNIQTTYNEDKKFYCKIEIILEDVNSKLNEFENHHPYIKEFIDNYKAKEEKLPSSNSLSSISNQ
jgi:hypothetical protein